MKTIYVHIGLCKTGTTALQHWFEENRERLVSGNLLYPRTGTRSCHHFEIASAFIENGLFSESEKLEICNGLTREINEFFGDVFLSSEHFSFIKAHNLRKLSELIGVNAKIVVCLRDQISWASAMYAEHVRWAPLIDFETFLSSGHVNLDYCTFLEPWEKVFGYENIEIIVYNKQKVSQDIFDSLRLSPHLTESLGPVLQKHPTWPALLVEIQRLTSLGQFNAFAIESDLRQMKLKLEEAGVVLAPHSRIPKSAISVFKNLDDKNFWLARHYGLPQPLFGRDIADLLEENLSSAYAPGHALAKEVVEALEQYDLAHLIKTL